ncbi:RNA polymerase subunit sigma-70 [Roseococcus sp. SYP-B2431]|uniref:anti-sigma factor n=1 Tax=Roseococcus sp. SYP-B2431 TaxID=2496640 RepID=UPI001040584D|nr:anti-sigma factor [Roseococcus sp. SYP-B2431]TCH97993.1 RNA polymerase subunit sigma-70 [Roseococcus sp. SYP-B2431]
MTPEERDGLAAEYVLGTLEAREAAELRRRMETDAELAAAVAGWERRLAPLLALAPPEAPPPDLWARIERSLGGIAAPARTGWRFPWPALGIGASAVAAGLAAFLVLRPPPQAPLMTVLLTSRDQPAWLVEAQGDTIRLAALNQRPVEPGRVAQLWALPQGATAPTSLGLVPEGGRFSVTPTTLRPTPGMLIEITLEPPGGSPTGRPTGPILFIGRLSAAGGA